MDKRLSLLKKTMLLVMLSWWHLTTAIKPGTQNTPQTSKTAEGNGMCTPTSQL
jgi:hypothetical protein